MSARVFVCVTCDRYASPHTSEETPGEQLAAALALASAKATKAIILRRVVCLSGCHHPCNAALRDPGKWVIRFSNLTKDDASALIDAADIYNRSAKGDLSLDELAPSLRSKL